MAEENKAAIPALPEFPTKWGEQEEERLGVLKEQRTQMEELYKSKFAPEAWEATPQPERAFRGLISETVFEPLVGAVTPWQWGYDYGLTPERARERMVQAEEEYQELVRMQRVVSVIPSIQNTLRLLALTNQTIITTREELDKYFKLTNLGFTEEEQDYVVKFAQGLLGMNKDKLISGDAGELPPITEEEIATLISGESPIISPNQILSTVAFSKDVGDITETLQMAYPPVYGELDETTGLEKLLQSYIDSLKELGVSVPEGGDISDVVANLPEMASEAFDELSQNATWVMPTDESGLPIIDPATNEPVVYVVDGDNYAWYGENIIGYYDEGSNNIVSIAPNGQPLLDESTIKDLRDAAYLSLKELQYTTAQGWLNTIPQWFVDVLPGEQEYESVHYYLSEEGYPLLNRAMLVSPNMIIARGIFTKRKEEATDERDIQFLDMFLAFLDELEKVPLNERKELYRAKIEQWREEGWMLTSSYKNVAKRDSAWNNFKADFVNWTVAEYEQRKQNYVDFLMSLPEEHPELLPRPEWDETVLERVQRNPVEVLDPGFFAYHIVQGLNTYLAAAGSIGVTILTGNPQLGMGVALVLFEPLMVEEAKTELMNAGLTNEQATEMAVPVGTCLNELECVGEFPVLLAFAPAAMGTFRREMTGGIGRAILRAGYSYARINFGELVEEELQQIGLNAAVKTVDESRNLFENVDEVALETLVVMTPLALAGVGSEFTQMRHNLPPEVQDKWGEAAKLLEDAGYEDTDLIILNMLTHSETGRAQVEAATEEIGEPLSPGYESYTMADQGSLTYEDWNLSTSMTSEEMSNESSNIQSELNTIGFDLNEKRKRLSEMEQRLSREEELGKTKQETAGIRDIIRILKEQIADLEARCDTLTDSFNDLMLEMEGKPVTKVKEPSRTLLARERSKIVNKARRAMDTHFKGEPTDKLMVIHQVFNAVLGKVDTITTQEAFLELWNKEAKKFKDIDVTIDSTAAKKMWKHLMAIVPQAKVKEAKPTKKKAIAPTTEEERVVRAKEFLEERGITPEEAVAEEEAPKEVALDEVEASPVGEDYMQLLLAQGDIWINKAGTRKANSLYVFEIPDGKALVRTDSKGKALLVVSMHEREYVVNVDTGETVKKMTVDGIVSAKPNSVASGKALIDIVNTLRQDYKKKKIVFAPRVEMTDEVAKMVSKIEAMMTKEEAAEAIPEGGVGTEEGEVERWDTGLPRAMSFKLEEEQSDMAVRTHPDIAKYTKRDKMARDLNVRAEKEWNTANEEERKEIIKSAGIKKSNLGKDWSGLSGIDRAYVLLSLIPDSSLHFGMWREIADMEEFMEFLEEATGELPLTALYERIARAKNLTEAVKEYIVKEFTGDPEFRAILQDEKQLAIATQELNARNEIQGVEHPEDALLTPEILALVAEIQRIYDMYKPRARYLEFMRTEAKIEAIRKRFPDAVKAGKDSELIMALELRNKGDNAGLYQFLKDCTWGVYEYGFDPRQIASSDLRTKDVPIGGVIGSSSLHQRTRVEFPGEGKMRRNLVQRMLAYVTQMEIQWEIEPEMRNFQKLWNKAYWKFDNKAEIHGQLEKWWGTMQGIPSHYGWAAKLGRRVWRQAMTAIFLEPVMSVRNFFQAGLLHMDRTELIRYLVHGRQDLSPSQRIRAKRFFDIFVSQLGGLRKYVLLQGQPGLPGLGILNRAADALNIYGWSDYIPRFWSFMSYLNKANRATQQYLKDGDIAKWLKNSGAVHLRQTERNFVLTHYLARANDLFDLRVDTLEKVTGAEMASFYVARRSTDHTHFKYARWARGMVEMGNMGETLFNLFVFPRGYGQRVAWQGEKIVNLFKGEATWEEARSGFNDLIKLFIVAQLFSSFWKGLTGRKRNPYDPMSILSQWTFGGLFVGALQDITELIRNSAMVVSPTVDEETRNQAKGRLPGLTSDLAEMLVPFYRRVIDVWAAVEKTPDQDVYWIRKMREKFEKDYTVEELEQLDMTLWEQMKKAALGAEPPDPDMLEKAMKDMQESRDMLGTRGLDGKYYTLQDHAGVVSSATKGFPDIFVSDYSGCHDLDVFYKDCEAQWEEYYYLPTKPSSVRKDWRREHPEEEAMMLFWGKLSQTEQVTGSDEWEEVMLLLIYWCKLYKIDPFMYPEGATWKKEVELGVDLTRPE